MDNQALTLTVFGAEEKCASCVHLPSAKETFEWLEAAISRKFPDIPFTAVYVDIETSAMNAWQKKMAEAIQDEEYFYPLVTVNEHIVAEGNPNLKLVFAEIEKWKKS
ncbi:YuzD family protein [Alkalihalobacillus oceani]|uniref:YuzD family protein n=1 Tax=Halalkalibacter oceani TaxID=1653776 RepID=UPI00203D006E|nr:YuzD family protein [Halalkalibacter oceani]MCM3760458.1 YuzD family protein [Halalkalibacter oceani]